MTSTSSLPPSEMGLTSLDPIDQQYLLVLVSVPFHVDRDGRKYLEALWAKDLIEHARYLANLTLAAPTIKAGDVHDLILMDTHPVLKTIKCVELPHSRSTAQAIRHLFRTLQILGAEAKTADIIHTSIAGWPIPEAWLMFLATRRRYLDVIIVESAFWRLPPGDKFGWRRRVRAWLSENVNRWFINRADISIFTQEAYRKSLLTKGLERGHVIEASWIDANDVIGRDDVQADMRRLAKADRPLRLVFAGRLTSEKGINFLIPTMLNMIESGLPVCLDIFGSGPEKDSTERIIEEHRAGHAIKLRDSLPYGPRFFEAIREFDALIVPTLTDEQPRIVYDAYSQGVPVIASDTAGLRQCVANGITGLLFKAGDSNSLIVTLSSVLVDRSILLGMRPECVRQAHSSTHREMHRKRWAILSKAIQARKR